MEKDCYKGLIVAHSEQKKSLRERRSMTTHSHNKGSEGIHRKSNHDKFETEIAAMKVQLDVMIKLL